LETSFTGPIATGLSLVAIVVGGLMFPYGEGQSKKRELVGIVFGLGRRFHLNITVTVSVPITAIGHREQNVVVLNVISI
jgi:type IV secretory pathway VirB2 component (pilin)